MLFLWGALKWKFLCQLSEATGPLGAADSFLHAHEKGVKDAFLSPDDTSSQMNQ